MSYSREQMIEAYEAGAWAQPQIDMSVEQAIAFDQQTKKAAALYVDSLQNARETDGKARGKSDLPESVPEDGLSLQGLDTTIREHILTSRAREVALAKILGGLLVKIPHGGLISLDWVLSEVERLNTFFPELDTES